MNSIEETLRKRLFLVCVCGAIPLALLTWGSVQKVVSARTVAIVVLAWWVAMFVAIAVVVLAYQRAAAALRSSRIAQGLPPVDRDECRKKIRSLKRWIAVAVVLLPVELWASSDQAPPARIEGALVLLILIALLVHALLRRRKELQAL